MHIYFSGVGGTGIGPLALIAHQAGYSVSGSDKQDSDYFQYLKNHSLENIHIGQDAQQIADVHALRPIDWFVHTSALSIENPDSEELQFCRKNKIKISKRDELINQILTDKNLKLIAIAGTHGKTTTTAMTVWLFKQLGVPVSYSVGAKISFGEMGEFDPSSEYFVYEADEFDRNFLQFHPFAAILSGVSYDHPDIYPSQEEYNQAFLQFIDQSEYVIAHDRDLEHLALQPNQYDNTMLLEELTLPGRVNRENALLVIEALSKITSKSHQELVLLMNNFPGLSRRFEKIANNIYSDYAHTPEKIEGALQMAHEVAGDNVVVVYEGLHNTRQHFIKEQLQSLFKGVKKLYVVPSYLAREDQTLELLTPEKLTNIIEHPAERIASQLNEELKKAITNDATTGNLVLCLSAGGGGSLDQWLRQNF